MELETTPAWTREMTDIFCHTSATHHVAWGTDLRTIQEALGHADLKTTSLYVQLAREVMKEELQKHAL